MWPTPLRLCDWAHSEVNSAKVELPTRWLVKPENRRDLRAVMSTNTCLHHKETQLVWESWCCWWITSALVHLHLKWQHCFSFGSQSVRLTSSVSQDRYFLYILQGDSASLFFQCWFCLDAGYRRDKQCPANTGVHEHLQRNHKCKRKRRTEDILCTYRNDKIPFTRECGILKNACTCHWYHIFRKVSRTF